MFMKSTRFIYQIRTPSQPAPTYSTQGKPQLQRWETTFPHHSKCEYFHKCLFSLSAPPPNTFDGTNWLKFFGRKFFVAVKIAVEIFMAHAMLTKRTQRAPSANPVRTQREVSPAHRLLSAGIINAMCRICMQHQARRAIVPRPSSPSFRVDIMLGRKFFSQILNCRSGINKREK